MKDLDFDELDKAVNSLMGGVKDKDAGDKGQTLDINATLAPDEKPAYSTLSQVAGQIGSEAIDRQEKTVSLESGPSIPPVPKKPVEMPQRSGRFMDVVHPSSDMKRGALAKVSREGATIAPAATSTEPIASHDEESVPQTETSLQLSDTSGNLPDSAAPELKLDNDESSSTDEQPVVQEPLSSPFLPGAKVEKRPLGSEPPTGTSPAPSDLDMDTLPQLESLSSDLELSAKEDESSVMDTIVNPSTTDDETMHVPEEFQNELLAVEKNTDTVIEDNKSDHHTPEGSIAVASIPKQYQEKPNSGETKSGAIFDTDHYHKPLAHPAKKNSGWLWVIAIVVIIALGAGAGAFVYFIGL